LVFNLSSGKLELNTTTPTQTNFSFNCVSSINSKHRYCQRQILAEFGPQEEFPGFLEGHHQTVAFSVTGGQITDDRLRILAFTDGK